MKLEDYHTLMTSKKRKRKYNNSPTIYRGHRCDSKKEAQHFAQIDLLCRCKDIRWFVCHPTFLLPGDTQYIADILYQDKDGSIHVQDVKGGNATITDSFKIKKRQLLELYNLDIEIV